MTYQELAERFYRGGVGFAEFMSLVDFSPDFGLTGHEVGAHEAIAGQHRHDLCDHLERSIAEIDKKIATAKDDWKKKGLISRKEILEKQLAQAKVIAPLVEYDGSRFYKFFSVIRAEAKKIVPQPGEKPEAHHQRVIGHLAGIIPGLITIKKTKR